MSGAGGNIELPFPAKVLWPNGRGHWAAKHREFKKHKQWAYLAAKASLNGCRIVEQQEWSATFYPKTANRIDADNAVASLKAYIDGIAAAIGVDDALFRAPTIHFAEPVKGGRVVIVLGDQS